jgi:hypothetical protein
LFFSLFFTVFEIKKKIALWSEAKQAPLPQGASSIFPSLMANKRQGVEAKATRCAEGAAPARGSGHE